MMRDLVQSNVLLTPPVVGVVDVGVVSLPMGGVNDEQL